MTSFGVRNNHRVRYLDSKSTQHKNAPLPIALERFLFAEFVFFRELRVLFDLDGGADFFELFLGVGGFFLGRALLD